MFSCGSFGQEAFSLTVDLWTAKALKIRSYVNANINNNVTGTANFQKLDSTDAKLPRITNKKNTFSIVPTQERIYMYKRSSQEVWTLNGRKVNEVHPKVTRQERQRQKDDRYNTELLHGLICRETHRIWLTYTTRTRNWNPVTQKHIQQSDVSDELTLQKKQKKEGVGTYWMQNLLDLKPIR